VKWPRAGSAKKGHLQPDEIRRHEAGRPVILVAAVSFLAEICVDPGRIPALLFQRESNLLGRLRHAGGGYADECKQQGTYEGEGTVHDGSPSGIWTKFFRSPQKGASKFQSVEDQSVG
jgi:hypothetical protein